MKRAIPTVIVALALFNTFPANALVNITQSPTGQVVSLNAHVTLEVTATSTAPPMTYQWYGNDALLPDQTSRTLVLNNIQLDQAGEYYVVVNDADNQPAQSNPAAVNVDPTFEKITEGPLVTDVEPTEHSTWWDFDDDGDSDVVVHVAPLRPHGGAQSFYRNDGNSVFTKITTNAVAQTLKLGLMGAVGDIDNDGDQDLYLGSNAWQANEPKDDLYRNEGNGRFAVVASGPWKSDLDHTFDCTFVDFNGDGLLDIFIINWDQPPCLYRQTVAGTFVKLTSTDVGPIVSNPGQSYNAAWVDYDNDGDLDLWFEEYRGLTQLYRNDGNGVFSLATPASFAESPGGIGIWADFDNDGYPELFVGGDTETGVRPNALYRGTGAQEFHNVAAEASVDLMTASWASAVGDYDNDGYLDLFAADWQGASPSRLFRNRGDGTFESVDVGSPIRDGDLRLGVRWVDYDNDGFLDLFMTCGTSDGTTIYPRLNHLYRNNLAASESPNHWLKVRLEGKASNRSGIGAKIRVKATIAGQEIWQLRELTGNGYSQTCPGLIAHFGLGDATKADIIRVEWPSGNVQELTDVTPDQLLSVTEWTWIIPAVSVVGLGEPLTLRSRSLGTGLQWFRDGVALEGETNLNLTLPSVTLANAGNYSVVVQGPSGSQTFHTIVRVDIRFETITQGDVVNDRFRSIQGAWGDYDGDGHLDLAVVGGYDDVSGAINSALYRNDGIGNLVKVLDGPLATNQDRNCYLAWADWDNDGDLDLAVGVHESNPMALYLNQGNGQFLKQRATADCILNGMDARGSTIAWGDYDADGLVDLMVINWVAGGGAPGPNTLLHNVGNNWFEADTACALTLPNTSEETVAWIDFDDDGDLDFSSVESGSTTLIRRLFRNVGRGQFEPVTDSPFWGERRSIHWGHVWADLDSDGDLDVIACVGGDDAAQDAVFLNDGHGNLTRTSLATMGLPADLGAIPAVGDFDNDGFLDLFCAGAGGQRNRLFHNQRDGTFQDILTGGIPTYSGYSYQAAWADYDGDGYLDLFVPNASLESDLLYRNNHREFLTQMGQTNHWLQINLRGTRSNRSGIGAKVRVIVLHGGRRITQLRQIGGQTCAPELFAHFGMGGATVATFLQVEWPSGSVGRYRNVTVNRVLTLIEPSLHCASLANGQVQLRLFADADRLCAIEVSEDLSTWNPLTTITGQGETPVTFIDTNAPGQNQRFYRMK